LRELLGVAPSDLVWIAGSTQAPEERYAVDILRRLRQDGADLRLFLVPRQKDRFDEVATLLERSGLSFVRRSRLTAALTDRTAIVLVDTIGELGALWGLADLAFVGGSMDGQRGGQNMIEPAAYGAAVLFGSHVWNFKEPAARLLELGGALQVDSSEHLERELRRLLQDPQARREMATAARRFVLSQQGATERTLALIDKLLWSLTTRSRAA
jgi:3-deoxy-D-manno-octulosonic-acid transferase